MIQQTSLEAYEKVKLGKRQRQVLNIFEDAKDCDFTNMEVAEVLGWSINRVTPRVLELRVKKRLRYSCTRRCTVTGNRAMAWMLFGEETPK